jgi:hypothetical protein
MTIRARVSYTIAHGDLTEEELQFQIETDDDYRPDVADDMTARALAAFRRMYADVYPEIEEADASSA